MACDSQRSVFPGHIVIFCYCKLYTNGHYIVNWNESLNIFYVTVANGISRMPERELALIPYKIPSSHISNFLAFCTISLAKWICECDTCVVGKNSPLRWLPMMTIFWWEKRRKWSFLIHLYTFRRWIACHTVEMYPTVSTTWVCTFLLLPLKTGVSSFTALSAIPNVFSSAH